MHRHCGTNNRAPRWTFMDPCKPEVRPGAREESASPAWLAAPAMNARDTTKVYILRLNVLFWGSGDFPVSYSNRNTSWNAWNRHSGSLMVDTWDLIQQYEVSLSRMLNDILILDQQWLPNQSDFPPISWPWCRAWPSPIMSGFHRAFATGVACQQGTLTLPDTWFRSPLWDLLVLKLLRPDSSNLPCLYSTFHLEYPLVLSRFVLHTATQIRIAFFTPGVFLKVVLSTYFDI